MRTVDLQEQEIFLEALEIAAPVARLDFIYQACGKNVGLRKRVQQLLSLQNDESFILDKEVTLDREGNIRTVEDDMADLTGETVGRYHLVRLLGSGGMGDVYLAEQKEPVRRRVAVKVVKFGMDTKSFVARFSAESQALAVMDHPGITKVFDAGATRSGRPYFAMELVSGDPITQFCDENRLSIKTRLEIFLELCMAIQHAHQKGLIHRDLKPSNILVSRKGTEFVSKVIDFGVVKVTNGRAAGQTDLTRHACMIGTPEYMSPEQTDTQGNDQDIRTDIYSLGAILYQLLTGSTPFELEDLKSKNIFSIREIIQTRSVESPSSRLAKLTDTKPEVFRDRELSQKELHAELKGNLDAVAMKCLAKDRAERYRSVAELVSDIARHLEGDSVEIARHPMFANYRRLIRKHRGLLILSATIMTFLVATSVFSLMNASRANRLANEAIAAEELSSKRLKQLAKARQNAQLEKAKSRTFEKQYRRLGRELRNEDCYLRAVVDFEREIAESDSKWVISKWLRNQLPKKEIGNLLPVSSSQNDSLGDTVFLQLLVEQQRSEFGGADPLVAETLDLLGEKYLNSGDVILAISTLQESLFIHTENDRESESRIRTMLLLAKALRRGGQETKADLRMETVRQYLEQVPEDSRLHRLFKQADSGSN